MAIDKEKLKHCMLFFLERINNIHLGRVKLMKLLYYVDFDHYECKGQPVTGALYRKLDHGPVPTDAIKMIKKLISEKEIKEVIAQRGPYEQRRLITLSAKFDPSKFSGDELMTLQKVADAWQNSTGSEIETASHNEAPWMATKAGQVIDYELALYRKATEAEPLDQLLAKSKKFKAYVNALP